MVAVALVGAFDHDGDGDLRIVHGGKAEEPGEVHLFAVSTEVGGAGLAADAEVVDLHEAAGAVGADDALHAFPQEACLFGGEADGFAAVVDLHGLFAGEGFEGGLGACLAACDGGDDGGHLEGCLQEEALTDGGIGGIAFIVFVLQMRLLPNLPSMFEGSFRKIPELLKNPLLVCLYLLILLVFTAHYTAYSYIEPFMRQVGSVSENLATFVLLLFGVAGIVGSVIFSRWVDRFNTRLMLISTILMLLSMLTLSFVVTSIWALSLNALLWGAALMLLIISMQAKVIMVDINAQDMLMSMFSGIINLGIGTGALFGGYAVTHLSLSSVGYVGAAIAVMALLLMLFMIKRFPELSRRLG